MCNASTTCNTYNVCDSMIGFVIISEQFITSSKGFGDSDNEKQSVTFLMPLIGVQQK